MHLGNALFLTSLIAAMISFHNIISRYTFSLGRERVLPRPRPSDVDSVPIADRDVSIRDTGPGQGLVGQQQ